jgi:protein angel
MQEDHFKNFFLPKFNEMGYECCFKKRLGESKSDGCAICFKKKKFELVKEVPVDYYVPNVEILNRENVGLVLLLKIKSNHSNAANNKHIVIATTHILYNPKRGDCKLAQMQMLLAQIDKVAFKKSKMSTNDKNQTILLPEYYPTILCGDFNCLNNSKLYEFVDKSKLSNYKRLNRNLISGQLNETSSKRLSCIQIENTLLPKELGISDQSQFKAEVDGRIKNSNDQLAEAYCTFGGQHLRHTFNFKSVYDHVKEKTKQLEVTSCIQDTKKIVDFIFFHSESLGSPSSELAEIELDQKKNLKRSAASSEESDKNELELVCKLRLFTEEELDNISLPNEDYPSDHFLLAAKFVIN